MSVKFNVISTAEMCLLFLTGLMFNFDFSFDKTETALICALLTYAVPLCLPHTQV